MLCSICIDNIDNDLYITSCNHKFHTECINLHIQYSDSIVNCPICRNFIYKKDNLDEENNIDEENNLDTSITISRSSSRIFSRNSSRDLSRSSSTDLSTNLSRSSSRNLSRELDIINDAISRLDNTNPYLFEFDYCYCFYITILVGSLIYLFVTFTILKNQNKN